MYDLSLTIMGNDWIVIIFVVLIMLLGTKRLPEASRKMGRFVGELNKTRNVVQDEIKKVKGEMHMPIQGPVTTERQKLEVMAKNLGIDSSKKTDEDLRKLITSKLGTPHSGKESDPSSK